MLFFSTSLKFICYFVTTDWNRFLSFAPMAASSKIERGMITYQNFDNFPGWLFHGMTYMYVVFSSRACKLVLDLTLRKMPFDCQKLSFFFKWLKWYIFKLYLQTLLYSKYWSLIRDWWWWWLPYDLERSWKSALYTYPCDNHW